MSNEQQPSPDDADAPPPLNAKAVMRLAQDLMEIVRDHQRDGARHPNTVLEALNALAVTAAVVTLGTGPDPNAVSFFQAAFEQQLRGGEPAIFGTH